MAAKLWWKKMERRLMMTIPCRRWMTERWWYCNQARIGRSHQDKTSKQLNKTHWIEIKVTHFWVSDYDWQYCISVCANALPACAISTVLSAYSERIVLCSKLWYSDLKLRHLPIIIIIIIIIGEKKHSHCINRTVIITIQECTDILHRYFLLSL